MALKKVKIVAYLLIILEIVALVFGLWWYYYYIFKPKVLGVSVVRINKKNVLFSPTKSLPYFYEWNPNEDMVHEYTWLPKRIVARTNSDGLIATKEYEIDKPESVFRIIALGDSNTEGPFVEVHETYPAQLESMLNESDICSGITRYEVLNFGVGGYDIQYAAHRFLHRGLKYSADAIVWLLEDGDFIDLAEESGLRISHYMEQIPDDVKKDMSQWEKYDLIDDALKGGAISLWEKLNSVVRKEIQDEIEQKEYMTIQTEAVGDVAESVNIPIVLATYTNTSPMFIARMKVWEQEFSNVRLFNKIPRFNSKETRFIPHDGHPNAKGYEIIAKNIFEYLERDKDICTMNTM